MSDSGDFIPFGESTPRGNEGASRAWRGGFRNRQNHSYRGTFNTTPRSNQSVSFHNTPRNNHSSFHNTPRRNQSANFQNTPRWNQSRSDSDDISAYLHPSMLQDPWYHLRKHTSTSQTPVQSTAQSTVQQHTSVSTVSS